MRYYIFSILGLCLFITSCGTTSRFNKPSQDNKNTSVATGKKIEHGVASWYGPNFHGKLTANGETYDMDGLTAAHRTLPFDSVVRVQNLNNGKSVQVRINDRGPFAKNRIIDLSRKAAEQIDMIGPGTADVELHLVEGDLANSRTKNLKQASYTVQLASYREEDKAQQHSSQVEGAWVEPVQLKGYTVYRVYYGTFTDAAQARDKQQELVLQGIDGYVKQIEN